MANDNGDKATCQAKIPEDLCERAPCLTQKKFELKDELTKELATKADLARLEGGIQAVRQEIEIVRQEMQTMKVELDRKFTLMFSVLLFSIVFLNQNALEFLARMLGLIH